MTTHFAFLRGAASCLACGWQGIGRDCKVGEVFERGEITEYLCPKCEERIRAVPWPTIEEAVVDGILQRLAKR